MPCSKNKQNIVWLALDTLDARQAQELRAHLETCAGCRHYLDEISTTAQRLNAVETRQDIQATEAFHQKLMGRLRAEESKTVPKNLLETLRVMFLNWRIALPAIASAALLIIIIMPFTKHPETASPTQASNKGAVLMPNRNQDSPQTLANYQSAAAQSLDKLDELLTRQGNIKTTLSPIYTVSTLTLNNFKD